jgi:flavin reductase (DIM6/NTAB) family NADH-FMN oxidoreductase RutF
MAAGSRKGTRARGADEADGAAIDAQLFRKVMGSFATGVTVVTTEAGGEVRGMTVSAFMSGSLSPPLCVVSIGKRARMHGLLAASGHFGVSILAKDQEKLSTHFAGGALSDLSPTFAQLGRTPVLANASATLAADIVATHDCGDHSIFIGRIVHMQAFNRPPLVLHEGRYASLAYTKERAPEWVADFW